MLAAPVRVSVAPVRASDLISKCLHRVVLVTSRSSVEMVTSRSCAALVVLLSSACTEAFVQTSAGAFSRSAPVQFPRAHTGAHRGSAARTARQRRSWLRASAQREEIEGLRAAEIKERLFKRGISTVGLLEKRELVDKLLAALADESAHPSSSAKEKVGEMKDAETGKLAEELCKIGGFRVPLSRMMAREGTLGDGVRIDEKDYYAVRARFPDLSNAEADFIVDSAASNSVVTPQWSQGKGAQATGVSATVSGGTSAANGIQQLRLGALDIWSDAGWRPCGNLDAVQLEVPVPSSVGGLLGLDLLSRFDAYLNFDAKQPHAVFMPALSACSPGPEAASASRAQAAQLLRGAGLLEAPLFYLPPPAGLYLCKVQLQCGDVKSGVISAIVDLGSTFSIMNSKAAAALGAVDGSPLLRETQSVVSGAAMPGQGYTPVRVKELDTRIRIGGLPGKGAIDKGTHCCAVADLGFVGGRRGRVEKSNGGGGGGRRRREEEVVSGRRGR